MNKKIITALIFILLYSSLAFMEGVNPATNRRKNVLLSAMDQTDNENQVNINTALAPDTITQPTIPAISSADNFNFNHVNQEKLSEPKKDLDSNHQNINEKKNENEFDEEETIDFNFENTSLEQLINYVADVFHYQFISPEILDPLPQGEKKVKGNLISFKTNRSLSKKEAWNLFLTFLNMAGFGVTPDPQLNTFRILSFDAAKRSPLPTYIGIDPKKIPEDIATSDQLIRYVYFIENSTVDSLKPIIDQLKSPSTTVVMLQEHQAILMVDRAYNIVNLMRIIKELDKVSMPQTMSVLKLRRAAAKEVAELYQTLIKSEDAKAPQNRLLQKKQPTSYYFPENVRVIAEERSNSLILLGPIEAIKKIENFVIQHIDVELDKSFSPLFVYNLKYANATVIAKIMSEVTQIGSESGMRAIGGVRGTDKFLKPMTFTADETANRIVIKGDYEDYLKAKEIIDQLDEPQEQVAVEVLLLSLNINDLKILGTQLRTKQPGGVTGLLGNNIAWQTSGLFGGTSKTAVNTPEGIQTTSTGSGSQRLLADLISLVTNTAAGNTIISLGDSAGAYAIIQALESISSTQTVANPFLLATNRTKASVTVGTTYRVVASVIIQTGSNPQNTYKDEATNLVVDVEPTINSDGMITLDIGVLLEAIIGTFNTAFFQKSTQNVKTKAIVADKEVIAIGGLIQDTTVDIVSKVPILGDIPILGWLFKNRSKQETKNSLLILVSTQVVRPDNTATGDNFTLRRINKYEGDITRLHPMIERKDPIHRWFFEDKKEESDYLANDFIFNRHDHATKLTRKQKRKNKAVATQTGDAQGAKA